MSKLQFVDLDTSSEDDDTGSGVVISKYEMRSKFNWWNLVGLSHIKKEVELTDSDKDTTEIKKEVEMEDQPLYEVIKEQQDSTEDEDESSEMDNTEAEQDDQGVSSDEEPNEKDASSQKDQPQEIQRELQESRGESRQSDEMSDNEKEATDLRTDIKGKSGQGSVSLQDNPVQETEKAKWE